MKKILYSLLCALSLLSFSACTDEEYVPKPADVRFDVELSGGVMVDGTIYAIAGQTLSFDALNVTNNDPNHLADLGYADYYLNFCKVGRSNKAPFGIKIPLAESMAGHAYKLEVFAPVYAQGKDVSYARIYFDLIVLHDSEVLPPSGLSSFPVDFNLSFVDSTAEQTLYN